MTTVVTSDFSAMSKSVQESTAQSQARLTGMTNRSLRRLLVWSTFTVMATAVVCCLGVLHIQGLNIVAHHARMIAPSKSPVTVNRQARWKSRPNFHHILPFKDRYLKRMPQLNKTSTSLESTSRNLTDVEITRSIRNHTVNTICKAEQLNTVWKLDSASRGVLLRHIIVDDQRKFLYCYVPKVACSNWKRVIKFMQGTIDDIGGHFRVDHKNGLVFLNSFSKKEISYRLENYYKFMFVRNPVERMLSAFRNKFKDDRIKNFKKMFASRIIQKYRKGGWDGKSDSITFEEFMRFLLDSDPAKMNEHWKPMHLLCQPCAVQYDFTGSFEQLHEDANYLLQRIKSDTGAYFPTRQDWYNPTTEDKMDALLNSIDPVYIQQYVDKFILDFITFGYVPPKQYYTKRSQVSDPEKTSENEVDRRGSESS